MPAHIKPRRNVEPASSTDRPASTLLLYAIASPTAASSAAYAISWRSNDRHAAPIERAVHCEKRAGSARMTPIRRSSRFGGRSRRTSVAVVEVAALEERLEAVILLDPEVQLHEVLDDLGRGVALRPGVVGEREHDELGIGSRDSLEPARVTGLKAGVLRDESDEPRVERQPALPVAPPELCRSRLAGDDDRQVDQVVRVPEENGVPSRASHLREHVLWHLQLVQELRLEPPYDRSVGPHDLSDDLRLEELAAVRQRGVRVDELDRRHDVVALPDAGLVDLAGVDREAHRVELPLVGRDDPARLVRQVDSRALAEPVLPGTVREPIDPQHPRHLEEERAARVTEATPDVAGPEPAAGPVMEARAAERQEASRDESRSRRGLPIGKPARSGHELVRRAGRVVRRDGVIDEWLVRVVEEPLVRGGADA